jgi:hypothetical protein
MQHVQYFALGAFADDIDHGEFLGDAFEQQLKERGRPNAASAANDSNFDHG